jgi:hypothetical protein
MERNHFMICIKWNVIIFIVMLILNTNIVHGNDKVV